MVVGTVRPHGRDDGLVVDGGHQLVPGGQLDLGARPEGLGQGRGRLLGRAQRQLLQVGEALEKPLGRHLGSGLALVLVALAAADAHLQLVQHYFALLQAEMNSFNERRL